MRGLVLAAGRGRRMGSLTKHDPKCMIKFRNASLVSHIYKALKSVGVQVITGALGYRSGQIKHWFDEVIVNHEWEVTNSLYTLNLALEHCEGSDLIVSYSDIFFEETALTVLQKAIQNNGEFPAILASSDWQDHWKARFVDPLADAEDLKVDPEGFVTQLGQKLPELDSSGLQYMGIIFLPEKMIKVVQKHINELSEFDRRHKDLTWFFNRLIKENNFKLKAVVYSGFWAEFDSVNDLEYYSSIEFNA